jgi:hypothetical protein
LLTSVTNCQLSELKIFLSYLEEEAREGLLLCDLQDSSRDVRKFVYRLKLKADKATLAVESRTNFRIAVEELSANSVRVQSFCILDNACQKRRICVLTYSSFGQTPEFENQSL